jgi:hypothetical protein
MIHLITFEAKQNKAHVVDWILINCYESCCMLIFKCANI